MNFLKSMYIVLICLPVSYVSSSQDVNLFIGTAGHGHTYPGATVPLGMVQLSPDTDDSGWDWCSGYNYQDSTIMGFSHTHLSGTGISDLADVLIMPFVGKIRMFPGKKDGSDDGYRSKFSHYEENAVPGYYNVVLKKHNIKAELTSDHFSGYHRYTFPETDSARVIIDLQHGLDRHRTWLTERVLDSELVVLDSMTLKGYRKSTGWANIQEVYFLIRLSKPFVQCGMSIHDIYREDCLIARGRNIKGVLSFKMKKGEQLEMKVDLSNRFPIQFEQHSSNVFNFDIQKEKAKNEWISIFDQIEVDGPTDIKRIFYTALYHNFLSPNIIHGQSSNEIELTTLSNWDTYRAANSIKLLFGDEIFNKFMCASFLELERKNGYLPVWKLWEDEVHCMVGSPGVPIMVENLLKLNETDSLYIVSIENSLKNDSPTAPWTLFDTYGYVPNDKGEMHAVSKTLEMCYAHGCAADLFKKLGNKEKYAYHLQKSRYYTNLFDTKSGFFRGKNTNGQFVEPFDPNVTNEIDFVEATPWQYLFHVQHDIEAMINLMGGKSTFAAKLDALFSAGKGKIDKHILDITGLIGQYAHGNEPSHHVAYLYNFADQPWKTQEKIHDICTTFYTDQPDGLCGNEDCGQMSAWYIFSALGFYPIHPTSGVYNIGKAMVKNAKLKLSNGNIFEIKTKNYHPDYKYIKAVKLNGERLTEPFISHTDIIRGGILEFDFSEKVEKDCYRK